MKRFVLCISFIQVGTPTLSTPDAVLRLAKTRIAEQLQKNYAVEAAFDSDRCREKVSYEVFAEGLRLSSTGKLWKAPLYLGFQELLDGQKINFPLALEASENRERSSFESRSTASLSDRSKKMLIWGTAIGLGTLGTYYYLKNHNAHSRPQPQPTQFGFAKTF